MSSEQESANLVFIPLPILSHQAAAVQTAGLLVERDPRLSVTIIVMKLPIDTKINSHGSSPDDRHPRIRFVELPPDEQSFVKWGKTPSSLTVHYINSQKGPVRDVVKSIPKSVRIVGFVVDMFCTAMIDIADELGLPSYIFFTCSASTLGLFFGLQEFRDGQDKDLAEYENSEFEISLPSYANSVPAKVWPSLVFDKDRDFLGTTKKFRGTKGIVVNTFLEFEPHAIRALSGHGNIPHVYPVGPIIQPVVKKGGYEDVFKWLDEQPDSSVVFVCFGSIHCFEAGQAKEIAEGLEKSGQRFVWSLRKPPPAGGTLEFPGEYEDPGEVLPEGFLERTSGVGKVIGWAPQLAVLAHQAVGGFVSHCGWNSVLESVRGGVPIAAWPLAAEQQANAFQLVREPGIAVQVKMEYNKISCSEIVPAERIERAVRELMGPENAVRRAKVRALRDTSRVAMSRGGSSYDYLGRFIDSIFG
ncbi:UDP-glycosyltransferase 71B1 [Striga hermonthica]|uniref:Glycosyltransferase n=1 Tax=Striga hermonthica TaxID=68872 RepID=A0A9N7RGZ1_STRHE|nr:UDP-glycosyltransferase 71B1 [Striga hermonthica]